MLVASVSAGSALPRMEGNRLRAGSACYTILVGGRPVGTTSQTVKASAWKGRALWDVVVHQKLANATFDMRDHFVLDRATLLPVSMDSERGVQRTDRGWHRIHLEYDQGRVRGTRETVAGSSAIDVPLAGATWDGNLWGLTFAALPLRPGAAYRLPYWQYEQGFGTFVVRVVGSEAVEVPGGKIDAWVLEAGPDPAHPFRYLIAKKTRQEIGYISDGASQRLEGGCGQQ